MKIAICTPVYGDTRAGFTFSLTEMALATERQRRDIEIRTFSWSTSRIEVNRERLVERATDWGADWIFWIDSDHSFPADTLLRLLSHGEPVVGCNQPTRTENAIPTARIGEEIVWTTPGKVHSGELEAVDHMGLAVCLVSMKAIRDAEAPLFRGTDDGEDVIFFRKLKAAGYTPKVDHALSLRVGHIGLKMYTHQDALRRRRARSKTDGASSSEEGDGAGVEITGAGPADT